MRIYLHAITKTSLFYLIYEIYFKLLNNEN